MALESASFIPELNITNPPGATDKKSQGDDHLRLIKIAVKGSFPAFVGTTGTPKSVSLTEDQINDASQKLAAETIAGDKTHTGVIITDDSTTARAGFTIPTGVAPTAPVEGNIWKTATDLVAYVNGAAKSLIATAPTILTAVKTADESAPNNTFQNDDDLFVTLVSGKRYKFEYSVSIDCANATPGFKCSLVVPGASTGWFSWNYHIDGATHGLVQEHEITVTNTIVRTLNAAQRINVLVQGSIDAAASGTLQLQWAQINTDGANPVFVREHSYMIVTQLN